MLELLRIGKDTLVDVSTDGDALIIRPQARHRLRSRTDAVITTYERRASAAPQETPMQKKLSVVGNSLGLIIDKPVLELLRIDKDTPLDVSTDGDALIIRPLRDPHAERVRAAALRVADQHAAAFEKLAK